MVSACCRVRRKDCGIERKGRRRKEEGCSRYKTTRNTDTCTAERLWEKDSVRRPQERK